jgi:predicted GIY-YIG superfamily endonuclease
MPAWFYILRLRSQNLYLGSTRNIERRVKEHFSGKGGRTTSKDPPASLVLSERFESVYDARKRELQVKRWTRAKKEALISGNFDQLKRLAKRRRP